MRLLAATALALLGLAAPAIAEVRTVAEVHTPDRGGRTAFPVLDTNGPVVAWSDYDASIDAWRLMATIRGVTEALPVPPRRTPFDVDLGPDSRGRLLAVYSRCARGLRLDFPTPQILRAGRYGCDLYSYSFATRREMPVAAANSRADEYWPSVWRGRIAFVRAYRSRRDPDRTATPYLYLRTLGDHGGGSRRLRRPPSVITVRVSTRSGRRIERRRLSTMIEGLDLRGRTVAYAWKRIDDFDTVSFIYLAAAGGGLRPAVRGATSGGGAADRVRTIGSPSLNLDHVDWLFQNAGSPEYFAAFARRITDEPLSQGADLPMAAQPTKAVAFAAADAAVYFIDGGPGAAFDPVSQPGGTFPLKIDTAVDYRRMPRSWLPIRPPGRG